jgi:hypothetical protein
MCVTWHGQARCVAERGAARPRRAGLGNAWRGKAREQTDGRLAGTGVRVSGAHAWRSSARRAEARLGWARPGKAGRWSGWSH